ncbi:MAG: hypothetical protein KKB81_06015 [Candidatus Margulisbacteria bacterium]|nr:hypothetical protein [Candidatus Margulisiibacteriota bacterium]MBU1021416.1 hypothetical protein [Candidatus Margulisiibacteriota bacterium]MBU1728337.1 hypothetical protein [Candidatus Margulisiibacteriota bacterium]MBU1955920.1 hypothetical protein [Candidatus Margulisiibacteriota bacterium]
MQNQDFIAQILSSEDQAKTEIKHNETKNHLKIKNARTDVEKNLTSFKAGLAAKKEESLQQQTIINKKEVQNILSNAEREANQLQAESAQKVKELAKLISQKAKELLCP